MKKYLNKYNLLAWFSYRFCSENSIILLNFIHLGCGTLQSVDGNRKIAYPICMYQVPRDSQAFHGKLNYVQSCPKQAQFGMAFCSEHCTMAEKLNIPTDLLP